MYAEHSLYDINQELLHVNVTGDLPVGTIKTARR